MTKYMNKQNGKVMEIVKEAEDGRAMIIKFEDGKTSSITTGTFKRWYKAFEVPETVETLNVDTEEGLTEDEAVEQAVVDPDTAYVAEVMEQKKELGIECPEITSYEEVVGGVTPLAQVGKEITKQAKQKAIKVVKKTHQTKEAATWVEEAKQYVFNWVTSQGDEVFVPNNIPMRSFKVGGHMYARMNFSKSGIEFGLKSSSIKEGIKAPDKILNHMFDAVYKFKQELTGSDKHLIETLLTGARNQRVAKNESSNK